MLEGRGGESSRTILPIKASPDDQAECKFLIEHIYSLSANCEMLTNTTVTIHLQAKYPVTNVGTVTIFRGEDPIVPYRHSVIGNSTARRYVHLQNIKYVEMFKRHNRDM